MIFAGGGLDIPCVRPVDSDFVRLGPVFTQILHVAEDMSTAVLADGIPQVCSEPHVGDGAFGIAPFMDGESLEQCKAFTIEQVGAYVFQGARKVGEWKLLLWVTVSLTVSGTGIAEGSSLWRFRPAGGRWL